MVNSWPLYILAGVLVLIAAYVLSVVFLTIAFFAAHGHLLCT